MFSILIACITCRSLCICINQIVRGNAKVKARLAQLLTDPSASNPRWLVKFDGLSLKDEEVYEHVFAKSPSPSSDNSVSDSYSSSQHHRRRHPSGYGSDTNLATTQQQQQQQQQHAAKRALAREARSQRRQAKMDEIAQPSSSPSLASAKRRMPPPPPPSRYNNNNNNNKAKKARSNNNHMTEDGSDEVVKVKLLTGTLYMYRGVHRRVEFVRRV